MEGVVGDKASTSGVGQGFAVRNAYKQLHIAVRSACILYDAQFQSHLESVEQFDEDINACVCIL